jgi:predicted neuraminidase
MAKYLAGVEWADKNHRYATGVIISDDHGKTFRLRGYLTGGKHGLLMEPRVVELGNGDVVMLIRSQRDGWLWESRSTDGGETWSKAVQSNIPNPAAKILLLRGEDGRIYLVHNPTGHDGATMGGRNPLSLWISDDDMKTWSVKVDLVRDDAPYVSLNYPDGFIDEKERILQFVWEDTVTVYHAKVSLDIKG